MQFQFKPRSIKPRAPMSPTVALDDVLSPDMFATPPLANPAARGWYASSLELREGLDVTEDVDLESLPAEWLDKLTPPR